MVTFGTSFKTSGNVHPLFKSGDDLGSNKTKNKEIKPHFITINLEFKNFCTKTHPLT